MYISKKVNWSPWKKREGKSHWLIEWFDALVFAVVAVTIINIFLFQNYKIPTGSMEKTLMIGDHLYVSKVAYGPRIPQTPLSFPFAQHTMPLTEKTKSYVEWIKLPYKRLKGISEVKRDDAVVFNFPAGDTVVVQMQSQSYYSIIQGYAEQFKQAELMRGKALQDENYYNLVARNYIWDQFDIVVRPVDRRDNYIKRCVAVAGETIEIKDRWVYVNGKPQQEHPGIQFKYRVRINGTKFNDKALEKLGIGSNDIKGVSNSDYLLLLNKENKSKIQGFSNVLGVEPLIKPKGEYASYIFPHNERFPWNEDNLGPLYIPKKGDSIQLNENNLILYSRVIGYYEGNDLQIKDSTVYINGKACQYYTFTMDYYFMMGDNRHDSADSRFWGLVPEDHVVGKPSFIWLSLDQDKKFPRNIRFGRMFKGV
ncbi:MAG: signal peptidase I [Bacteroidales bacterium]|nr:signal peptidase I [Bacteroidales bacterium]